MKRLTTRDANCADPKVLYGVWVKNHDYISAANRLADYEDTGLTPEQCENAKVIIEAAFSDDTAKAERIRELLKADKDGRVVVRPSNKALTNADRIRAATNQQLAKLLYDNQKEFCRLMYKSLGFENELEFSEDYSDILAWLETPVEAEKALEAIKDA
nr:MAG TPA: hypothetical protein [Caudoviricetes sp.]